MALEDTLQQRCDRAEPFGVKRNQTFSRYLYQLHEVVSSWPLECLSATLMDNQWMLFKASHTEAAVITIRKSSDRGHADHGWLLTYHTFSFADYYDPQETGWGSLRVINEDRVQPGEGFGTHSHRDMEIITYVLEGQLQHKDSMGNGTIIQPGEVQRMSAGSGVRHSEFNPSPSTAVHFLQIWIEPEQPGIQPGYEQKVFTPENKHGRLLLIASRDGRESSLTVHQKADIYASLLSPGEHITHQIAPGRLAYLHLVKGTASVNGIPLSTGDGAKIESEDELLIAASEDSELLLFDMF